MGGFVVEEKGAAAGFVGLGLEDGEAAYSVAGCCCMFIRLAGVGCLSSSVGCVHSCPWSLGASIIVDVISGTLQGQTK